VACCCEHGDEPSVWHATELVSEGKLDIIVSIAATESSLTVLPRELFMSNTPRERKLDGLFGTT
jgi:hypothetical protein